MRVSVTEELLRGVGSEDNVQLAVDRWRAAATICFLSGTVLAILGMGLSVLSALHFLVDEEIGGPAESALILAALVLFIAAAHSLDRILEIKRASSEEHYAHILTETRAGTAEGRIADSSQEMHFTTNDTDRDK